MFGAPERLIAFGARTFTTIRTRPNDALNTCTFKKREISTT
jgi:hypothetical protein